MPDRRSELLDAATAWVLSNGLSALSLRPLAAALGTSDRMLVYYFGSRDNLVAAIAGRAADGLAAALPPVDAARPPKSARVWLDTCWALFTDPAVRPAIALLFELDALAVRGPGPIRAAAQAVGEQWSAAVTETLEQMHVPPRSRAAVARVVAAAMIGLLLDTVTSGIERPKPDREIALLAKLVDEQRRR